jgi:hypothetical protein
MRNFPDLQEDNHPATFDVCRVEGFLEPGAYLNKETFRLR